MLPPQIAHIWALPLESTSSRFPRSSSAYRSEVDPLLRPFCGAEMKIITFILDFAAAKAIRKSLELPAQEPEPLAHAPPETLELIAESA